MDSLFHIRVAKIDDVPTMFNIMRESLAEEFLKFTIYQASQSIHHLSKIVSEPTGNSGTSAFVVCAGEQVKGFATIRTCGSDLHLNYIAVATSAQGQGLGKKLLQHYEDLGIAKRKSRLTLDVFDNNILARDWYLSNSFEVEDSGYYSLLPMEQPLSPNQYLPELNDDDLVQAYLEENKQGLSSIECVCGPGTITIGFIAGKLCNLRGYTNITQNEAIGAIINRFRNGREALLVTSGPAMPEQWIINSSQRILHLVKLIDSSDNRSNDKIVV